mgnify:CR=1 FL=1
MTQCQIPNQGHDKCTSQLTIPAEMINLIGYLQSVAITKYMTRRMTEQALDSGL